MKKTLLAALVILAIPATTLGATPLWNAAMTTTPWASLANSPHDFTASNPRATYAAINASNLCESCHAPHEAIGASRGPLWNHSLNTGASAYTMYGTTIAGNGPSTAGTPGNASLRCLGCHDGTLPIDAYGGSAGTATITVGWEAFSDKSNVTTDLTDDHPVGYNIPLGDAGWQGDLTGASAVAYGGDVECASCHDPHGTGVMKFLRAADFCTDCHDK
jgi:predicted CXXCH cytochrome family protein